MKGRKKWVEMCEFDQLDLQVNVVRNTAWTVKMAQIFTVFQLKSNYDHVLIYFKSVPSGD